MTTIKLKNGSGAPTAGDLVQGEPALDLTNKRLYTENASGTVIEVGTNPTSLTTGTFTSTGIDDNATSTAITIDSSENVGIGTASPTAKLDVVGDIEVSTTATIFGNVGVGSAVVSGLGNKRLTVYETTSSALVLSNTNNFVNIFNGGTVGDPTALISKTGFKFATATDASATGYSEKVRITSSGNVGIGTSSPEYRTQITSTSANNVTDVLALHNGSNASGTGTGARLLFKLANFESEVERRKYASIEGVSTSAYNEAIALVFKTQSNASGGDPSERLRIDSSGNLLVGKTTTSNATAGAELNASGQIVGTFAGGTHILGRNTNDGSILELQKDGTTVGSIGTAGGGLTIGNGDTGVFFDAGNDNIRPFSLTTNGSLDAAIDLGRSTTRFKDLYLSGGVYLGGTNASKINSNVDGTIIYDADPSNTKAYTAHIWKLNGSESARIDSSGNLLVGTTDTNPALNNTPGIALRSGGYSSFCRDSDTPVVIGRKGTNGTLLDFRKDATVVGSISVTGSSTSYNTTSDQRLKENIADANDAGSKIDALQVRQYDWKADGSHQDYGMIAQELQAVAPEAVSGDPNSDEMMGVDYSKLVPMLIKEIQSLRNRVAQLEEE